MWCLIAMIKGQFYFRQAPLKNFTRFPSLPLRNINFPLRLFYTGQWPWLLKKNQIWSVLTDRRGLTQIRTHRSLMIEAVSYVWQDNSRELKSSLACKGNQLHPKWGCVRQAYLNPKVSKNQRWGLTTPRNGIRARKYLSGPIFIWVTLSHQSISDLMESNLYINLFIFWLTSFCPRHHCVRDRLKQSPWTRNGHMHNIKPWVCQAVIKPNLNWKQGLLVCIVWKKMKFPKGFSKCPLTFHMSACWF